MRNFAESNRIRHLLVEGELAEAREYFEEAASRKKMEDVIERGVDEVSREVLMEFFQRFPEHQEMHNCANVDMEEHRMSNCRYGCKVYQCRTCCAEKVWHSAVYGCKTLNLE